MEVLAIVLVTIWALGIVAQAAGTAYVFKNEAHPMHAQAHQAVEQGGAFTLVLLTLLVVFWPAVVVFNLLKK